MNWMNRLFVFIIILLFAMCRKIVSTSEQAPAPQPVETATVEYTFVPVSEKVNDAFRGFYIATPPAYIDANRKFPLLVFLHGLGQIGNGSTDLNYIIHDGIGKLIHEKKFPISFNVHGQLHSFIVLSPQSTRQPTAEEVKEMVDYIIKIYRVDTSRIYLSGLSMGAKVVTLTASKYPLTFAAIIPIAGVADNPGMQERCKIIASHNLPVWEFHNVDDPMADVNSAIRFVNYIKSYEPAILPRMTIFDTYGHDAWTTALSTSYKEDGKNIYEWMLQFTR